MKAFAIPILVSCTVLTLACEKQNRYPTFPAFDPSKVTDFSTSDAQNLSPKTADGVSKNNVTLSLKPNAGGTKLWVPFAFKSEDFRHLKVKTPIVTAEGCSEKPELGKFLKLDSDDKAYARHRPGG